MTHRYQIADLVLETNVPLPEATTASVPLSQAPECRFHWMGSREAVPRAVGPFHRWVDSAGKPFVWFYHREDGYQIRVRRMADFLVSKHADEIRCYPRQDVPPETIRQLFIEMVLPVALSRRGRLSLHASAVVTPDGAVGFLGGSGTGKSTLAVALAHRGWPVLCDDSIVLRQDGERTVVLQAYSGVRLRGDSMAALNYTEERRFRDGEMAPGAMPLRRLYMLVPSERQDVHIEKMSQGDAIVELVRCSHILDVTDKDIIRVKFGELTALAERIPCFRLEFPHEYERLDEVCAAVIS